MVVKDLREQLIKKIGGEYTSTYLRSLKNAHGLPKRDIEGVFDAK